MTYGKRAVKYTTYKFMLITCSITRDEDCSKRTFPDTLMPFQTLEETMSQEINRPTTSSHTRPSGSSMPPEICNSRFLQGVGWFLCA